MLHHHPNTQESKGVSVKGSMFDQLSYTMTNDADAVKLMHSICNIDIIDNIDIGVELLESLLVTQITSSVMTLQKYIDVVAVW